MTSQEAETKQNAKPDKAGTLSHKAGREIAIYILLTTNLLMIMEKEMKYETPEVEILTVKIESGFEGSTVIKDDDVTLPGFDN